MTRLRSGLLVCVVVLVAGCGGGGAQPGKKGGDVSFLSTADIDYADPALTYFSFGFMVQAAVNRALYQFRPDSEAAVPDLAEGAPQISDNNRTITVKLKPGIRYAPPVDREVTSHDVKYAIERAFTRNVPSSYAMSYFAAIEGAPPKPVPIGDLESFSGILTPDERTLVLKLTEPVAQRVVAALVLPITAPVPEEYARRFDRRNPSTYDRQVAFSGPYMIRNNRRTGELVGRDPGKRVELVRNPNWDAATDFRPAYLNSITIEAGNEDLTRAVKRTLSGKALLCCDTGQPLPAAILRRALDRFPSQVGRVPAGGTRWIALNTKIKPFDNLNVRRAVIAGFDRIALRATRGSEVGPVAQGYLPPGLPGHEESGGEDGFEEFDWMRNPNGDPELSKKYMLAAKEEGVPVTADGRYGGPGGILTVATNAYPGLQTARIARSEFEKLGFDLNFRQVPQDTLYGKFCGNRRAEVAICPDAAWFKDFADPEEMLRPTFSGDALSPAVNVNWSRLDVRDINEAMEKASLLSGDERAQAWADINRSIVERAPGIPYLWDDSFQIASSDLDAVMSSFSTTWDLSHVSIK